MTLKRRDRLVNWISDFINMNHKASHMKCIKVRQDSDSLSASANAAIKDGESLDSYTTISYSIIIFPSLVQSNQQD
jgi:hypothetical protein